ncbi:snRNA-activating protein complex subunit 2 [Fukomys damarensis]|uniref:snRNA-activating protein complex subunit 2 n=1 Tax=Fukomys damarensis TaxID=885580 RepID=UPI00054012D3|nr:snRNA-activating protein complex subunit 2 [Fukomys damarensis]
MMHALRDRDWASLRGGAASGRGEQGFGRGKLGVSEAGDPCCTCSGQIHDFLQHLKGRVAREAIQRVLPAGAPGPRRRRPQILAPIEVWTDLAEKITGPLEEALTAAFSQVLTIAATEPLSLLHSVPPKPTGARGKPLLLSGARGQEDRGPVASGPARPDPATPGPASVPVGPGPDAPSSAAEAPAESLAGPSPEADLTVDFEKIYKYLSFSSRSGHGPELSAAESAVVLDLLLSLPKELPHLPCAALAEHMTKTYVHLTAPEPSPSGVSPGPRADDEGTGSRVLEEPGQVPPGAPELRSAWRAAGICPLNPFLVPLELLGREASLAR